VHLGAGDVLGRHGRPVDRAGFAAGATVTIWQALLDIAVALLLVGLAGWAVAVRSTYAAVVGFIAYGLLLTLAWVQLGGIDVALTEAAIGGGLTGALLIGAAAKLRASEGAAIKEWPRASIRAIAALLSAGVAAGLAVIVLLSVPAQPIPTLAPEVAANIAATGVGNPITAVLLAFRALDTLLEAIVLLFALLGIWSLAPDAAWGGRPGRLQYAQPDGMLAYAARVLPPVGIVVGMYIFWIGADHPGGKFQGATILAAMWLLVIMAGLGDAPPVRSTWLRLMLVGGPLLFIAIGLVGAIAAGSFLAYPPGLAKPLILAIEFALMPTLTLVLALMLLGAPLRQDPP
jgi:multisubunit Na+/H+ antiporter MnhB subunit